MKKTVLALVAALSVLSAAAQTDKKKTRADVINRAGDHLMLQLSNDHWIGRADSVDRHLKGISRGLNAYVMLDKVFKGAPQMSVAFGLGVSTSNIYFKNMSIDLKSQTATLPFRNLDSTNRFKKYKITTAYLEVPVELRFTAKPERENRSVKAAIGFKVGTMLNAHTKGKNLQDASGKQLNSYTSKESSRSFFNSTRLAATARVGYGNFSLFGSYQINNLFKDGVAPETRLLQVGLTLSGL